MPQTKNEKKQKLGGIIASEGMVLGRAYILKPFQIEVPHKQLLPRQVNAEVARFEEAISKSRKQMETLLKHSQLSDDLEAIFEAQFMILEDPMLIGESREKIHLRNINAEWALEGEMRVLKDFLLQSENSIFQERAADLEDVGNRILRSLMNIEEDKLSKQALAEHKGHLILISDTLAPSVFLQLPLNRVEGIVCQSGGITSHLAILSKSHNIPSLMKVGGVLDAVPDKGSVFLDCVRGELVIGPEEEEQKLYHSYLIEKSKTYAYTIVSPVKTADGVAIELWSNLDKAESALDERVHELSGVGLFRTEFLYLKDPVLLTNPQKHTALYLRILKNLMPKPVNFRLLDVGYDKPSPHQILAKIEKNLRGIRFLLSNRKILISQLESILIAVDECQYPDGQCRIILPMINSWEELQSISEIIKDLRSKWETRTFRRPPKLPIGIMLETPAALEMTDVFSQYAAFFCVGSNDLTHLNLALNREEDLSTDELFYHPAFFRQIKRLLASSKIPVSLCGTIAAKTNILPLLLGLGVRRFSIPLSAAVDCAQVIEKSRRKKCQALARRVLEAQSTREVSQIIENA